MEVGAEGWEAGGNDGEAGFDYAPVEDRGDGYCVRGRELGSVRALWSGLGMCRSKREGRKGIEGILAGLTIWVYVFAQATARDLEGDDDFDYGRDNGAGGRLSAGSN